VQSTVLGTEQKTPLWQEKELAGFIGLLRETGIRSLRRMYSPAEQLFHFRLRRTRAGIVPQGISVRYTAITLIGLRYERSKIISEILHGGTIEQVCRRLIEEASVSDNLGDVALCCWAASLHGQPLAPARERLLQILSNEQRHATVELSWALSALTVLAHDLALLRSVATQVAECFNASSKVFPHLTGNSGYRTHVACFADQVYPILALSDYSLLTGDRSALEIADRCAGQICRQQGLDGQWWWHYDVRTGRVIEGYPVYAIHQDAMAPMALFALREAGGPDFSEQIALGLKWLAHSPELKGESLVDLPRDVVWRKVARQESRKFSRYLQAGASWLHPDLRIKGIDVLFPPVVIDYETRPYHFGWLLYAIHRAGSTWK